jgi:signal transduction histidine kinase
MEEQAREERRLVLRIEPVGSDRVRVSVQDNGAGIAPENVVRIFSHGFTTKRDGHGFGLHSCALAAQEMGGTLSAQSAGPGAGATFILELPIARV